jgi:hypothetical protein
MFQVVIMFQFVRVAECGVMNRQSDTESGRKNRAEKATKSECERRRRELRREESVGVAGK